MIIIRGFSTEDLEHLTPPAYLPKLPYPITGITLLTEEGVICCFGMTLISQDTAIGWALFSYGWQRYLKSVVTLIKEFTKTGVELYNLKTLKATADFREAQKLLNIIGFIETHTGEYEWQSRL